jgi:hypothetical protein
VEGKLGPAASNARASSLNNQQSGVRYTWDGMTTYGMIERSSPQTLTSIV